MSEERTYGVNKLSIYEIANGAHVGLITAQHIVLHLREPMSENAALKVDRERYQWLANRVLGADYGDNETNGKENGWRIVHDLLEKNGRQPAFMFGKSIDEAIDAAMKESHG